MAKTYYILRHGLTRAVKTGTGYGENMLTAPILKEAKKPLEKIGEYLKDKKIDYYASSPLKRCEQTAEIISKKTEKKFILDKRLTEFFMESGKMLEKRIKGFLKEINVSGFNGVALCTHGSVISMLITQLVTPECNVNEPLPAASLRLRGRSDSRSSGVSRTDSGTGQVLSSVHPRSKLRGILAQNKYDLFHYPDPGVLVIIRDGNLEEINFN